MRWKFNPPFIFLIIVKVLFTEQLFYLVTHLFCKPPKTDNNGIAYYILWNDRIYRHPRSLTMFYKTKEDAIKNLIKILYNRSWGLINPDKKVAKEIIHMKVLSMLENKEIEIKQVKFL